MARDRTSVHALRHGDPSPITAAMEEPRAMSGLCIAVPITRADAAARVGARLGGVTDWEVILVDDAPGDVPATDPRVRRIARVGRNGLTQTCLVAMLASGARHVALADAEAFDPPLLAAMLDQLRNGGADLVVATRRRASGGALRHAVRTILSTVTRWALSTDMGDPASGVFMIRRDALEKLAPSLSPLGHQVLLDLVATARGRLRIAELPAAEDGARRSELRLAVELLALMLAKLTGDAVSIRFLLFCFVGLSGVAVHLALLDLVLLLGARFVVAQTAATIGAMIWNFSLNNIITYGDRRLTGWAYVTGLIRFMVICGIGAVSNIGVATFIYAQDSTWWIAGLGGAVMGAVWNYAVSAVFVWRGR
jgi:dolichol-phosphate mannosyltransferase